MGLHDFWNEQNKYNEVEIICRYFLKGRRRRWLVCMQDVVSAVNATIKEIGLHLSIPNCTQCWIISIYLRNVIIIKNKLDETRF